jgi:hypothetical protein
LNKSTTRHCERSEAIQGSDSKGFSGLPRRFGPVRRYSRRPFELVRRMRRKPPVLTLAMTRFMAREHFPAGKGISQ